MGEPCLRALKYFESLSKFPQTVMLVFTAFVGYFTPRGSFSLMGLLVLLLSEFLAIAGTTAINMYYDRDIDALMDRTKNRPIPSGFLSADKALAIGYGALIFGLMISFLDGTLLPVTILLGYVFDVWVYTVALKRKSSLNIVFGGVAGAMPILGGWVARTGSVGAGGLILSLLILLWIPLHTWVISLVHRDDYIRAGVPMVPIKVGLKRLYIYLFFALAAFFFATFELAMLGITTWLTPALSGSMIIALMAMIYKAFFLNNKRMLMSAQVFADVFLTISLISVLIRRWAVKFLPEFLTGSELTTRSYR